MPEALGLIPSTTKKIKCLDLGQQDGSESTVASHQGNDWSLNPSTVGRQNQFLENFLWPLLMHCGQNMPMTTIHIPPLRIPTATNKYM